MREGRPVFVTDVHLDPSHALEPVLVPSGYASIFAAVYLHDTIVGVVSLPVRGDTVAGQVLANAIVDRLSEPILRHLLTDRLITQGLAAIDDPAVLMDTSHAAYAGRWPTVTAAVCTRGRPDDLERCLLALVHVDYPSPELLVIDNAPVDTSVKDFVQQRYPQVRYVPEPRPGLDWARNRAILEARGEILAFTDDDAVPDRGWLKALAAPFAEEADVMAVAGLVAPDALDTAAQQLFERHGGLGRGFVRRWVHVPSGGKTMHATNLTTLGAGANMAFRRRLFDHVAGFDPALGAGTVSGAGDEIELFFRVLKAGHTIMYEPAALVRHRHRRDHASVQEQLYNWLRGTRAAAACVARDWPEERWPMMVFGAKLLTLYFPRRMLSAVLGSGLDTGLVLTEVRGLLAGRGTYAVAQRNAEAIAARFASEPTLPPPTHALRHGDTRVARRARRITVDVDAPLPLAVADSHEADTVHIDIERGAIRIGAIDVITGGAPLTRRRVAETIVDAHLHRLGHVERFRQDLRVRLGA